MAQAAESPRPDVRKKTSQEADVWDATACQGASDAAAVYRVATDITKNSSNNPKKARANREWIMKTVTSRIAKSGTSIKIRLSGSTSCKLSHQRVTYLFASVLEWLAWSIRRNWNLRRRSNKNPSLERWIKPSTWYPGLDLQRGAWAPCKLLWKAGICSRIWRKQPRWSTLLHKEPREGRRPTARSSAGNQGLPASLKCWTLNKYSMDIPNSAICNRCQLSLTQLCAFYSLGSTFFKLG